MKKSKYIFFKKCIDIIFAFIALLIISIPLFIVAGLIKMTSKGPVFFMQARTGKDGKVFKIYKFRTMKVETVGADGEKLSDFERTFPFGNFMRKWSVDELPQLINILKGEMSFIGPRPLPVRYFDYYDENQLRRFEVLPGISGYAQVNGRNSISWEEKFEFDVWYVDNISLLTDLKIFFKTIMVIFAKIGINNSSEDTMPSFDEEVIIKRQSNVSM